MTICDSRTCQTCAWFRCDGIGSRGFCVQRGVNRSMPQHCDGWVRTSRDASVFVVRDKADGGEPVKAFADVEDARRALRDEGMSETDRGWESEDGEWMTIEEVALCRP